MKKIQINIDWGMVFWVSIIILFIWLLAKALGLINTPLFVQAIPIIAGFIALVGFAKEVGKYVHRMNEAFTDIKDMKKDIHNLDKRVYGLETSFNNFDKRIASIELKI